MSGWCYNNLLVVVLATCSVFKLQNMCRDLHEQTISQLSEAERKKLYLFSKSV